MASSQLSATPIILMSSRSVSCHVFLGRPLRLFPPSGIHCNAVLAGLDGGSRSICPMNLLRLSATMSCRFIISVLCSRSAFVTWSFQLIPSIFLRHLLLKTSNMRPVFSPLSSKSLQHGITTNVYRCSFVFLLILLDLHMGRRRRNTDDAFPIRVHIS